MYVPMYLCVVVSMYVHRPIIIYIYIYIFIYLFIYLFMCVCVNVYVYVKDGIYRHTYVLT